MTDRLTRVEQTQGEMADYLDALAVAVRKIEDRLKVDEMGSLEALLSPMTVPRIGAPGPASAGSIGQSDIARTVGGTEPYVGRGNILNDPAFEKWPEIPITLPLVGSAPADLGEAWRAWYRLDSGTAPTLLQVVSQRRGTTSAPINSSRAEFRTTWGAATGSISILLWAGPVTMATALPYVVGAVRYEAPEITSPNDFTVTAEVRILDAGGAQMATSPVGDIKSLGIGETLRLHGAEKNSGSLTRFIEAFITISRTGTSGGVASVIVHLGDPQLHASYTPDPLPYAPHLGHWYPDRLEGRTVSLEQVDQGGGGAFTGWWRLKGVNGATEAALAFLIEGEAAARIQIMARQLTSPNAVIQFGDGSVIDTDIRRGGPQLLQTGVNFLASGYIDTDNSIRRGGLQTIPVMAIPATAAAASALTLSTTATDVAGATLSLTPSTPEVAVVSATFDFEFTTPANTIAVGELVVDGNTRAETVVGKVEGATSGRFSASRTWVISLSAASHTIKLQARKTVAVGTIVVNASHTNLSIVRFRASP